MSRWFTRKLVLGATLVIVLAFDGAALAQYKHINLVSNQAGMAKFVDSDLVNAWGISVSPTGPFWVSDNVTGLSTLYTGKGVKQSLVVTIPAAGGGTGSLPARCSMARRSSSLLEVTAPVPRCSCLPRLTAPSAAGIRKRIPRTPLLR